MPIASEVPLQPNKPLDLKRKRGKLRICFKFQSWNFLAGWHNFVGSLRRLGNSLAESNSKFVKSTWISRQEATDRRPDRNASKPKTRLTRVSRQVAFGDSGLVRYRESRVRPGEGGQAPARSSPEPVPFSSTHTQEGAALILLRRIKSRFSQVVAEEQVVAHIKSEYPDSET